MLPWAPPVFKGTTASQVASRPPIAAARQSFGRRSTRRRRGASAAGVDPELVWAAGEPGHEIVDTAKRIHARAIVLGEHHHGFLSRAFGGDVDATVQREAGCTVILA